MVQMPKILLSFAGGGTRVWYTLKLLQMLVDEMGTAKFLSDPRVRFAGVSSGALLALALYGGMTLSEFELAYLSELDHIFHPNFLGGLFYPKYGNKHRQRAYHRIFGGKNLDYHYAYLLSAGYAPVYQLPPFIVAFNMITKTIAYDWHTSFEDVAMATTSAPVYFPTFHEYVDGGIVENQPASLYCAEVEAKYPGLIVENMFMRPHLLSIISVGTGTSRHSKGRTNKIWPKSRRWGLVEWSTRIINALMSAENEFPLPAWVGRHISLNGPLSRDIPLDDTSLESRKMMERDAYSQYQSVKEAAKLLKEELA